MLNKCDVMGRLTSDPELKTTQNGISVCTFTIAVDRDYKGPNGDRETDFLDIVAWRSTAEFVTKYFAKGRMAVVSGRLQVRKWQDQNGNNRRSYEIVADNVYFGDSKREDQQGTPAQGYAPQQPTAYQPTPAAPQQQCYYQGNVFDVPTDDDLPF